MPFHDCTLVQPYTVIIRQSCTSVGTIINRDHPQTIWLYRSFLLVLALLSFRGQKFFACTVTWGFLGAARLQGED